MMPMMAEAPERRERPRMDDRMRREVETILREQYDSVKALLRESEAEVHQLARALAEKGELSADDVRRILNGKLPTRTTDSYGAFQSPDHASPPTVVPAPVPVHALSAAPTSDVPASTLQNNQSPS